MESHAGPRRLVSISVWWHSSMVMHDAEKLSEGTHTVVASMESAGRGSDMGTATVRHSTHDEVRSERARLLADVGMTAEELNRRAKAYMLTEREHSVWRRVRALDWLNEG